MEIRHSPGGRARRRSATQFNFDLSWPFRATLGWAWRPLAVAWMLTGPATAAFCSERECRSEAIRSHKSPHFEIFTDVDASDSQMYLRRMERVLREVRNYWGKPLPGRVICYLVADVDNWSASDFPIPNAQRVITNLGGGTDVVRARSRHGRQAVIYATTAPGVLEHEVVHAYCGQTFGRSGPEWYREGMAELFSQDPCATDQEICRPYTLAALQANPLPSAGDIMQQGNFTRDIARAVKRDVSAESTTDWTDADQQNIARAKICYAHSWALCHLLYNNPNYRERFQAAGKLALAGHRNSFRDAFAGILPYLEFELAQFAKHLDDGYRVDLCRWDWDSEHRTLEVGKTTTVRVVARRGYQTAKLRLRADQQYRIETQGDWHVEPAGTQLQTTEHAAGRGQLESVVMRDFELGEAVAFDRQGQLNTDSDGTLYLRCRDEWQRLSDNRGMVQVRITRLR